MIIYESTKQQFMDDVTEDTIAVKIHNQYVQKIGRAAMGEINAWNNSMNYLYKVLNTSDIPNDVGIAIEYRIPATPRRVDFMITGLNEQDQYSVVIIELKQWTEVETVEDADGLVQTYFNRTKTRTSHPSYQAWSYARLINDYNEAVQNEAVQLYPCAYLHNYIQTDNDPLLHPVYDPYIEEAPIFSKGDALKLRGFITTYIKKTDRTQSLYLIEHGKIKPSKSLQDSLLSMLQGNQEFIMIDDQKVVYEEALRLAKQAQSGKSKS